MIHVRSWLFVVVPLAIMAAFVVTEDQLLAVHGSEGVSLNGVLQKTVEKAIDLDLEICKLFISSALSVMGVLAFYVKTPKRKWSTAASVGIALALVSAVVSVFFGHLWMTAIRDQLARDVQVFAGPDRVWPERLQYLSLVLSLCLSGLVVLEQSGLPAEQTPKAGEGTGAR